MSTSDPIQPYPTEPGGSPAGPVVPPKPPRNTIGLIGLIVAILGFAFAVIEGAYLLDAERPGQPGFARVIAV